MGSNLLDQSPILDLVKGFNDDLLNDSNKIQPPDTYSPHLSNGPLPSLFISYSISAYLSSLYHTFHTTSGATPVYRFSSQHPGTDGIIPGESTIHLHFFQSNVLHLMLTICIGETK